MLLTAPLETPADPLNRRSGGDRIYDFANGLGGSGFGLKRLLRPDSAAIESGIGGRDRPVAHITVKHSDRDAHGSLRAELSDDHPVPNRLRFRYEVSYFIPTDFPVDVKNSVVIGQWHTPDRCHKPQLALRYRTGAGRGGRLDFTLDHKVRDAGLPEQSGQITIGQVENFPRGVWTELAFEIVWSAASDGSVEIWMDSRKVADYRGQTNYAEQATGPYFKYGLYPSGDVPEGQILRIWLGPYKRSALLASRALSSPRGRADRSPASSRAVGISRAA